jgi:hypothetical protein
MDICDDYLGKNYAQARHHDNQNEQQFLVILHS